ncbi:MAG: nucleoside 2-deoxyribosyltransferase domain-containing protein [Patescibacteria group bacterium]|jgi:nucleoside 2-deoxyribosyltransferase
MKLFLTSTLHNDWNLKFNPKLTAALESRGFTVHMPQRDTDQRAPEAERVRQNMEAVKKADACVIVLENQSMNLAAETGYAYGTGRPTIALVKKGEFIHWMLRGMLNVIIEVEDIADIDAYIGQLEKALKES